VGPFCNEWWKGRKSPGREKRGDEVWVLPFPEGVRMFREALREQHRIRRWVGEKGFFREIDHHFVGQCGKK